MLRVNVVYYGNVVGVVADLRYAYRSSGGVWRVEAIESGVNCGWAASPEIKIDAEGKFHVGYVKDGVVKYAYGTWGSWITESVSPQGGSCDFPDLAVASNGGACISYGDATDLTLKYARRGGAGWDIETGASGVPPFPPRYTSLALDGGGYPHISWYENSGKDLKYTYKNGSGWQTSTLYSVADCGQFNSIGMGGDGYPRISWVQVNGVARLWHSYKNGTRWYHEMVDNLMRTSQSKTSLAIDGNGYSHISWYNYVDDDLMHSYEHAGGWTTKAVDTEGDVGSASSLAIDADGGIYVSYKDKTNDALKFAYRDGGMWIKEVIDGSGDIGDVWSALVLGGERVGQTYFLLA